MAVETPDRLTDMEDLVRDLVARLRSDELVRLRALLAWAQRQMPYFKLPPRFYLIPDTNCVLKEIDYLCRRQTRPGRTALEEVVDAGLVRLFAPLELEGEVAEHLPEFARNRGGEPDKYWAEWERYRRKIHMFRAAEDTSSHIADPDDMFLLRGMETLGADAVVTDDALVLGATKALRPTAVQIALRTMSREEAIRVGLSAYGMLAAVVSAGVVGSIGKAIWQKPKIGIPIVLLAALGAYFYDRKAVRETGTSAIREALGFLGRGVGAILHAIEDHAESAKEQLNALGDLATPTTRSLDKLILANLIAAEEPLPLDDLVEEIHLDGFDPWATYPDVANGALPGPNDPAWQQFRHDVDRTLRCDRRFYWTGKGWTTRLLLNEAAQPVGLVAPGADVPHDTPVHAALSTDLPSNQGGNDAPKVTKPRSAVRKRKTAGKVRKKPPASAGARRGTSPKMGVPKATKKRDRRPSKTTRSSSSRR